MRYAIGVTVIILGIILVYAGFSNVNVWETVLNVIRNKEG